MLGLREIELQEEYRSDRNDIASEFFFPCLSNCIEYDRCVDFLSIQTLATISMAFDNFVMGKAKLKIVTGHRFIFCNFALIQKDLSDNNFLLIKKFDRVLVNESL